MTTADYADIFAYELLWRAHIQVCTFGSFSRATISLVVTDTDGSISSLSATGASCAASWLIGPPSAAGAFYARD
jgi:hypothetical protein